MILLVLPSNIERAPYIQYYVDIFEANAVDYRIVYWNRDEVNTCDNLPELKFCRFDFPCRSNDSKITKFLGYKLFIRKVKKTLRAYGASLVIVFTAQLGLFMRKLLIQNYDKRYIIDIRDYSYVISRKGVQFQELLNHSATTVISSKGFCNWLPKGDYLLSHNVRHSLLDNSYETTELARKINPVLTIGQLRDYKINREIAELISTTPTLKGMFYGYGETYDAIEAEFLSAPNMVFMGRYNKENEGQIVSSCSFINALTSVDAVGKELTTNRFYLSVLYKRPLIVMSGTHQAELVRKFDIGVVIDSVDELNEKLNDYIASYDSTEFSQKCDEAIRQILNDIIKFEYKIMNINYLVKNKGGVKT